VRVLGEYPRVRISAFGQSSSLGTDIVVQMPRLSFTIQELGVLPLFDLEPGSAAALGYKE
jgi:hypothetical protein